MHETFLNLQFKITEIRQFLVPKLNLVVLHDLPFRKFEGAHSKYKHFFKDFGLKISRKEHILSQISRYLSLSGTLYFD